VGAAAARSVSSPGPATATEARPSLEVRASQEHWDAARDAFVAAHPRGTLFHDSRWRRAVNATFGHQGQDLLAFQGQEVVGVLPLMLVPSLPRGNNLISAPYGVYGGPLGATAEVEQRLLEAALELARRLGVGRLELRCREPLLNQAIPLPRVDEPIVMRSPYRDGLGFFHSPLYWTFIKSLPESSQDVLGTLPKKARAEARKARERHGLKLVEGSWYLEDLHRMFARNKHSLGSPSLPLRLFQTLLRVYGASASVHLVHAERKPLSAVLSFAYGDTLIAYYSGTAPDADRNYSASNFMYMALQEWAVAKGYRRFDFCRSRRDSGAFDFKRHQGFEPAPLDYAYAYIRKAGLPALTPSNPRTKVLRDAWTRLPLGITERISPLLSRYLA
jgi:FemAB-related protein (PEP-CTERM system-associated)